MKISYLCYDPVLQLPELARRMERVAALGYDGIELVATYPLGYDVEDVRRLSERYRLPVVSLP
jgi:sugar phosphate isomerase/epimerase